MEDCQIENSQTRPEEAEGPFRFSRGSLEYFVFAMGIFFLALYAFGELIKNTDSMPSKFRISLVAFNVIGLISSFVLLPRPAYKSPFTPFFQLIQALAFMYSLNIFFMAVLDSETLKVVLEALDPRLAQPTIERSYSIDCQIYTPDHPTSKFANVMGTMDIFVSAHFFGWLIKTLIFRNNLFAWMMSISFEIYELSLRHWLPNFYECWWDSLFLDLFGCNMLGILIGAWIMRKFNMSKYHWFFEPNEKTENMNYVRRLYYSLTEAKPYLETNTWHWLNNPTNFLIVTWLVILNSLTDLSNFLNKKMLNIPANHFLLVIRIWIVGFFSILAVSELYEFSRNQGEKRKITFNLGLSTFIIFSEMTIFVKNFQPEFFEIETPTPVIVFWTFVGAMWVWLFVQSIINSKKKLFKS